MSKRIMETGKNFHDFAHIMNVYGNVEKLLRHEEGNRLVLLTAALFHDIQRDVANHGTEGAAYVKKLLATVSEFPEELVESVIQVIDSHDKKEQQTREQILFYDADKMDAFSELGIVRSFMMYAKEEKTIKESCEDYTNLVDHFFARLRTKTAKKIIEKKYTKTKQFALSLIENYESLGLSKDTKENKK
ncbi:MAG: HD domain-containing protein [Candidatus Moraniibacteriota bacterium]